MSDPNYRIMLREEDGATVVLAIGELDLDARIDLVGALWQARGDGGDVIADLAGVTFIDSSGMHALVEAWRFQTAAGRGFVLRNPSARVRGMLMIAGLEELIPIEPGPES